MLLDITDKPSAPRGPLEVSDVTRSGVTLSWLAPLSDGGAALVAYVVERREHLSPTWTRVARVKPQTTVHTVQNLAERTDYQFRVYAENVEGAGPPLTLDVPVSPRRTAGRLLIRMSEMYFTAQEKWPRFNVFFGSFLNEDFLTFLDK